MSQPVLWGMKPTHAKAVPTAVPNRQKQCQRPVPKAVPFVHEPTPYVVGGGSAQAAERGTGLDLVASEGGWTRYRICPQCGEWQPPNAMRTFLTSESELWRCCIFCGHWAGGEEFERVTG